MKDGFVLYSKYWDILKDLPNEDMGILFKTILKYQATKEIDELPANLKIAFNFIKNQFDLDDKKYQELCEKQKANGLKGGRPKTPKNPKNPMVFSETQKSLKEKEKEKGKEKEKEKEKEKDKECVINTTPHTFGSFQNVYLTDKQKKEFDCLVMDKKTADEIINNLSENIACKKEQIYDDQYPDMHLLRLKKYWQYYRSRPQPAGNNMSFSQVEQLLKENAKKLAERKAM